MSTIGKARDNIRMREAARLDAAEVGFINVTKEMEVLGVEGDWLRVRWNNKEGYVMRKFVLVPDTAALEEMTHYAEPRSSAPAAAEQVVEAKPKSKKPAKPTRTSVKLSAKKPVNDEE